MNDELMPRMTPGGQPQSFEVGPVSFRTNAADVRYLEWAGTELVRRVFITVRDRDWQEVPPSSWSCSAAQDHESLALRLAAQHTGNGVDFCWRGQFKVDVAAHRLSFAFVGTALTDMVICRLGLVVLHPLQALVGGAVETSGPAGKSALNIGEQIHPQPILGETPVAMTAPFDMLITKARRGASLQFDFTGDLFELEDQRNWCDASFKSYCRPLALGFPRQVAAGASIAHQVDVGVALSGDHHAEAVHGDVISFQPAAGRRLPRLGVLVDPDAEPSTCWTRSTAFDHVRIDLPTAASPDDLARVKQLLAKGQSLELGLVLESGEVPPVLLAALGNSDTTVRILLLQKGQALVDPVLGQVVADGLRKYGSRAPIFTVINDYFVELNRSVPRVITGTGIAFFASPTAHSADVLTIAENVSALQYVIQTARHLYPGLDVAVSPLALGIGPIAIDRLQAGAALAWFVASYEALARSGVTSVTITDKLFPSRQEQVPLAAAWDDVLETLARAQDGFVLTTSVTADSPLHILSWEGPSGSVEFLIANLADEDRRLRLGNGPRRRATGRLIWHPLGDGVAPVLTNMFTVPAYGVMHGQFSAEFSPSSIHDLPSYKEQHV